MARIVLPTTKRQCMHQVRHATWRATDGDWGVCMMAPSHIERCVRMLVRTIRSASSLSEMLGGDWPWPEFEIVYTSQDALEMFLHERNRRIMEGKWKT